MGEELDHGPRQVDTRTRNLWVISFADFTCLLLAFFALLFSMSTLNKEKWPDVAASLSMQRDASNAPLTTTTTAHYNIATIFRKRAINLDYLHAVLHDTLAADPQLNTAQLNLLDDRLVISLPGDILFAPASAVVDPRAEKALFALGGVLSNITNPVAVVGHSDHVPLSGGGAYTSNWELTIGRAAAVANVLKRTGYTRDVAVLGAGDGQFGDLPPASRGKLGRRVDVLILSGGG